MARCFSCQCFCFTELRDGVSFSRQYGYLSANLVIIDGIFQVGAMLSAIGMKIYEVTPFVQMLLSSSEMISSGQLFKAVFIGAATSILFFVLAHALFYRAELK